MDRQTQARAEERTNGQMNGWKQVFESKGLVEFKGLFEFRRLFEFKMVVRQHVNVRQHSMFNSTKC